MGKVPALRGELSKVTRQGGGVKSIIFKVTSNMNGPYRKRKILKSFYKNKNKKQNLKKKVEKLIEIIFNCFFDARMVITPQ